MQLTDTVRFCARDGVLWREEADQNTRRQGEKADGPKFEVSLPEGGDYPLPGGRKLHIRVVSACFEEKTQGVHKKDLKNQADYAKINSICPVLRLRYRQPGDRFRPAGRGVDRELRKWMNEAGIPPRERDTLPLLARFSSRERKLWETWGKRETMAERGVVRLTLPRGRYRLRALDTAGRPIGDVPVAPDGVAQLSVINAFGQTMQYELTLEPSLK